MMYNNLELGLPLCPGSSDVILTNGLQHTGSRSAHNVRRTSQTNSCDRQHPILRAIRTRYRQKFQIDRKDWEQKNFSEKLYEIALIIIDRDDIENISEESKLDKNSDENESD